MFDTDVSATCVLSLPSALAASMVCLILVLPLGLAMAQSTQPAGEMASDIRLASDGYFRQTDGTLFMPLGGVHGNVVPLEMTTLSEQEIAALEASRKLWNGCADVIDMPDAALDAWFKHLADCGINTLRLFPRRAWATTCWTSAASSIRRLRDGLTRVFAAARPHGVRFLLQIIPEPSRTSYVSSFNVDRFVLPRLTEKEMAELAPCQKRFLVDRKLAGGDAYFTDPDVLACQKLYLQQALAWVATQPQVFALEIYNEQGWWKDARTADRRSERIFTYPLENQEIAWTAQIVQAIKQRLPQMPVCLSHAGFGVTAYDPLTWARQAGTDFYSSHLYSGLVGEWWESDFAVVTAATAAIVNTGSVNFPGEWGVLDHSLPETLRRLSHRDAIWLSLMNRAPGFLQWEHVFLDEYRRPAKVFAALPKGFRPSAPAVAVKIGKEYAAFHTNSRYALYSETQPAPAFQFIKEKYADANLRAIYEAVNHSLDIGVPIRFVMDSPEGALTLAQFAQVPPPRAEPVKVDRPIEVVGGYQLAYIKDAGSQTYLAYLRSRGVKRYGESYLGLPAPATLRIKLNLPEGQYAVRLINLTQDKLIRQDLPGGGSLGPQGLTSDDYVLVITPADEKLSIDPQ